MPKKIRSFLLNYIKFLVYMTVVKSVCTRLTFDDNGPFKKGIHLLFEHVLKVCANGVAICKSNNTKVCAVRIYKGTTEYLDFENACFLFINNMCENFENEYNIVSSGTCFDYFKSRRSNLKETEKSNTAKESTAANQSKTANLETTFTFPSTEKAKPNLRDGDDKFSTLYEVETAFDYHTCPLSCPDVYSPVCVNVNRGHGLYFKFFTFVNHCAADLYYCKNWQEFSPPPDEQEIVMSSQLSWSMCAANRFIQFARFTEMTSSMGHYGWLAGDYRPSRIMEPHERMPGYG